GRSDESVEREARKDLREIAARYKPLVVDILKRLLDFVFHRIYDGVDVDEEGMKRLVEASKKGPLILCPCHKSHIDYMILSMICDDYGLQPPHVAAGDNLNFWPVGRLLREGGADPKTVTADEKKKLVQQLGLRIAAGINAAAPLAPTGLAAAVLLSHDRRALSETEILDRAEFLHTAALDAGAHGSSDSIRDVVRNAVESLCADGTLVPHEAGGERFYAVPEERRIALDYHKNGILHFLVAPAILSAALRSFRG